MFERFSESARRALFFARYEVTLVGGTAIEPEHLLLGLLRELRGEVGRILVQARVSPQTLRREIEDRLSKSPERLSTSVEIPFSASTKRVLQYTAEEADRLRHRSIQPEHMLLAVLREQESIAASVLDSHGIRLDQARKTIVELRDEAQPAATSLSSVVMGEIEHIKQAVDELARLPPGSETQVLVDHIRNMLDGLKRHFVE